MRNFLAALLLMIAVGTAAADDAAIAKQFASIQPTLQEFCFECHSNKTKEGELDLQRFSSILSVQADLKPWQAMVVQLETGEMPPKDQPQPSQQQRQQLLDWTRKLLNSEARRRAGERGNVPLHRLSNSQYDNTIRDLTGIDLQATRDFPDDGAAGEGFTNAAESLNMSPALMSKYMKAAKEISEHAILLPDGFRFSASTTKRDWTDESLAALRKFYRQFTYEGSLPLKPYIAALVQYRGDLNSGKVTIQQVATEKGLSAKYLAVVWHTLNDAKPSFPLNRLRTVWIDAGDQDVDAIFAEVSAWFDRLWEFPRIGSYVNTHRQKPKSPAIAHAESTDTPLESSGAVWDEEKQQIVVSGSDAEKRLLVELDEFRHVFPPNICYPHIIPLDEVVCLKTFHREDQPLRELFLSDEQTARLEHLWREHRFISRFPLVENEYLPLFIGFVTQDQPKELVEFFEGKRPEFQRWADKFEKDFENAAPQQLAQLGDFAARAYRRPLTQAETQGLTSLYQTLRDKHVDHETAFRSVLARVLMSPSFLLHLEQSGSTPRTVDDWTLASRLSFFLWSTIPDEELRRLAAVGRLHEPEILVQQTKRMLADDRIRSLAIEFGTQWIQVRRFDQCNEKNAALFPEFDSLRSVMYEEAILLFENLFRRGGSVTDLIDADHTYLNEALGKHYAIEGVIGDEFQRVEGVKKSGRGGILGLACVQSKQSGASRTSPILRGNWVVETLLGEKLPLPPPGVPQLPESEIGNDGLTMRQITMRHVSDAKCASCHQRIDPFGLALEQFDPIGRWRDNDLGGLPVDATAKLADGTQLEGIDGLKRYLMTEKRDAIIRVFYQRLLGYALGRAVSIPDQVLLNEMLASSDDGSVGVTSAVVAIVQSQQFQRSLEGQP